jgi:hypothetical protein
MPTHFKDKQHNHYVEGTVEKRSVVNSHSGKIKSKGWPKAKVWAKITV